MIVEKHVNVPVGFGLIFFLFFWGAFQKRFSPIYQSDFPKPRLGMIFASSGEFAAGKGNADCRPCQRGQYQDMEGQGTKSEFDHREMCISPFSFLTVKGAVENVVQAGSPFGNDKLTESGRHSETMW